MVNQLNKIKRLGVLVTDEKYLIKYLEEKHVSRYISIIGFMKKYNLPLNDEVMFILYKADVVIRRDLARILKPIEIRIRSQICYWLEEMQYSIEDYLSGSFLQKDVNGKNDSKKFMIKVFKKIYAEHNFLNEPWLIAEYLTFGQISLLLQLIDEKNSVKIFKNKKITMIEWIDLIGQIVKLRNQIAHHSIILSISNVDEKQSIKEFIIALSRVTRDDYIEKFENFILKYKESVSKKVGLYKQVSEEDINLIFKTIFDFIL